MNPVLSGRVVRSFRQRIGAPPAEVFPLLCPVREAEWLDGWSDQVEMVHSESGFAEEGCVFRTRPAGRPETVWMMTRHDSVRRLVEFHRITTGLVATHLRICVEAAGESALESDVQGESTVEVTYTLTPLGPEGLDFVRDHFGEADFRRDMIWWEESMNHWLRTGEVLRANAG